MTRAELTEAGIMNMASEAPERLRCQIDGKLLGTPLRSPYGHVFEKTTLEEWNTTCGSVCPVTGKPLNIDDCKVDYEIQDEVYDFVEQRKNEAMERRRRKREKKEKRRAARLAEKY